MKNDKDKWEQKRVGPKLISMMASNSKKSSFTNSFVQVEQYLESKYAFRYNVVLNEIEYRLKSAKQFETLNESTIFRELMHNGFRTNTSLLSSLFKSDFVESYNPLEEYFHTLEPWDGTTDYISTLASFIIVTNQERFIHHFKKHLVRSVACALNDDYCNKQALILVGEAQNSGKSTLCRFLCPPELTKYFTEVLNPNDKDGLIALVENFLINLDELAVLAKAEINKLKSMFSTTKVKLRRPFEKNATSSPRRASFVGSTNKMEFLSDETGSVRWLCFEVQRINWQHYSRTIDINKVWAQAYSLFNSGFRYELSPDEISENDLENRQFSVSMPEMEIIQSYYLPGNEVEHDEFYTATDFLNKIYEKNPTRSFNSSAERVGKALKQLGFIRAQKRILGSPYPCKGYYVKFL